MGADDFQLKMEEFQTSLVKKFKSLRHDDSLFDVTIVCGKNKIRAHRVVLSTWSPVLSEIIKNTEYPNPVIYLRGFREQDLVSMVDFMYCGEAHIKESDLETFLNAAKDLQVSGLTPENNEGGSDTADWNMADGDIQSHIQSYSNTNKRIKQELTRDKKAVASAGTPTAANLKQEAMVGSSGGGSVSGLKRRSTQSPAGSSSSSDTQDAIKSLLQNRQVNDPKTPVKYVPQTHNSNELASPVPPVVESGGSGGLHTITVPVSGHNLSNLRALSVDGSSHLAQASKQYQPQLSQATYLAQTTNSSGQALLPAGAGQLVGGVSPIQLPIRLPSSAIPVTNVQHPFRPQIALTGVNRGAANVLHLPEPYPQFSVNNTQPSISYPNSNLSIQQQIQLQQQQQQQQQRQQLSLPGLPGINLNQGGGAGSNPSTQ